MWAWSCAGLWLLVAGSLTGHRRARRKVRSFRATPPQRPPVLDDHAYAYLRGGRRRTAHTALTALCLDSRITVEGSGVNLVRGPHPDPAPDSDGHPVLAAALAACRPGRSVSARRVEKRTERSTQVCRVGEDLARDGLITHPGLLATVETWSGATILAFCAVSWFVLAGLIAYGGYGNVSAGLAAAATVPAGVLTLLVMNGSAELPDGPTPAGRELIDAQRQPVGKGSRERILREVAAEGVDAEGMPLELARALYRPPPSAFRPDDPPALGGVGGVGGL